METTKSIQISAFTDDEGIPRCWYGGNRCCFLYSRMYQKGKVRSVCSRSAYTGQACLEIGEDALPVANCPVWPLPDVKKAPVDKVWRVTVTERIDGYIVVANTAPVTQEEYDEAWDDVHKRRKPCSCGVTAFLTTVAGRTYDAFYCAVCGKDRGIA